MKDPAGVGAGWPALLVTLRRSHTTGMQSKVHPTYKTKYRVANWLPHNQALVRRGDVTVWLSSEAIAAWTPGRSGRRSGQRRYSDLAIETALTLRLLYHLPLRQAEGFLHALFGMMRLDLSAPDSTTLSRRSQHLRRRLWPRPARAFISCSTARVCPSLGKVSGPPRNTVAAADVTGRKLHLGVDQSGVIRVHTLTEATGDDATTALDLLTAVDGPLVRITADAAYDTVAVYETAGARGATVVIPPARTANVSGHGPRSPARDRTITLVKQLGRRQWKKASRVPSCPSRIRCQAATGSWTNSRQWEIQRTLFSSARATVWPPAKVNGRVALQRTSALTNAATIFGTAGTRSPHGHEKRLSAVDRRVRVHRGAAGVLGPVAGRFLDRLKRPTFPSKLPILAVTGTY